jgi:hypothetical protein
MVTKDTITYSAAPYGVIGIIPAGTPVHPAVNLPDPGLYWVEEWPEMNEKERGWYNGYGFLVEFDEVQS